MNKFTIAGIVCGWVSIMAMAAHPAFRTAKSRLSQPDTLILRPDTLIDNFVKDSAYRAIFTRDTTVRIDSAALRARADSARMALPEIQTGDLNGLAVCAGAPVSVTYTMTGRFNPDNRFLLQLVDPAGKTVNVSDSLKTGPISATVPANTPPGSRYLLRVASTSPAVTGSGQPLRVLPAPTARIELPDGGTAVTVLPGQPAVVRVALSGQGPWSFVLSDGTKVTNTMQTPYEMVVTPDKPTVYKVLNVSGPCGSGTTGGEVIVNVNENPAPQLALKAPNGGYRICTGTPFQVAFNATGKYGNGNAFIVQLGGDDGSWTNISGSGTASPLVARLPYGIAPKGAYKLRVISSYPSMSSDTARLAVAAQASVVLRSDTIRVEEGKPADLTLDFAGGGPWFVLLSDGTYENNISKTPHTIRVTPANPTPYAITSAGGACGVGEFTGRAFVKVNIPPSAIATGNLTSRTICYGSEITVPFTSTGRFYANNKFIVQIADSTGQFISQLTTYKDGVLKGTLSPAYLMDTVSTLRLRVISTSPAVTGSETTLKMLAPNAAIASVTGEATIRPGQTSKVRVAFKNGLPPWSFTLSDGTQINGTFLNPYILTVAPTATTEYTVTALKNGCGTGQSVGKAVVKVDRD